MGDKFLAHIERCKILLHLIDATDKNWYQNYKTVRNEIGKYSKKISSKKEIIVLSKADLFNTNKESVIKEIKNQIDSEIFVISSLNNEGVEKLIDSLFISTNFVDD